MRISLKTIVKLLMLPGPALFFLSLCFPWFVFFGTAEYYWGTVEVSGWVSAMGEGALDRTGASVTMWSSTTHWTSAESDFWFGYLIVSGIILVSASVLAFMKTNKIKISVLLALVGCSLAVSTFVIAMIYYRPQIFIIHGQIDDIPMVDAARLYATQATVEIGLGPWLSLIGASLSSTSVILAYYLKTRARALKKEK